MTCSVYPGHNRVLSAPGAQVFKKHSDLRARFAQVADDLQQDPFAPHLEYHQLGGRLKGIQAVRLTDSYRITLTIVITEKEIILLDIGSRDEVYR